MVTARDGTPVASTFLRTGPQSLSVMRPAGEQEHRCAAVRADGLAQIKPQHRVASGLNTRLFFDLIDRRYNKEGNCNMVFTSNKNPALWREDFNEDSTLLCALDRIFDEATVFKLRGESFRGKKLDTVSVQTGKVKAVELLADQQEE